MRVSAANSSSSAQFSSRYVHAAPQQQRLEHIVGKAGDEDVDGEDDGAERGAFGPHALDDIAIADRRARHPAARTGATPAIRDLSLQSSSAASQTSIASSELSSLAASLNKLVARFSL